MKEKGIRVKPMIPWPGSHGVNPPGKKFRQRYSNAPALKDIEALVVGPPKAPDSTWTCDTDIVWPVIQIEHSGGITKITDDRCVCRHQIQAGD